MTDQVPGGIAERVRTTKLKGQPVAETAVEVLSFKNDRRGRRGPAPGPGGRMGRVPGAGAVALGSLGVLVCAAALGHGLAEADERDQLRASAAVVRRALDELDLPG